MNKKITKRKTLAILALVIISFLSSRGNAQSQNQAAVSAAPYSEQAQKALVDRINSQSEGKAALVKFMPTITKRSNAELDGETFLEFGFEAQVKFIEPCQWSIKYEGHPLSFKTFKLEETDPRKLLEHITISEKGKTYTVFGSVLFRRGTNGMDVCGFTASESPKESAGVSDARCVENMKRIGLAFRLWSGDHGDHYPFNVSTNLGGTKELCDLDSEGFDKNTPLHFLAMSNELSTPEILVCPDDSSKHKLNYTEFQKLSWGSVSYKLRTGASVDESNPEEILAVCPIHGFVILCEGSVQKRKIK